MIVQFGKNHSGKWEIGFVALLFSFTAWIMLRTFSYDYETSEILIASAMWSDFGSTLPLIRSFSMGDNWPPEYPIFPGLPIRYHYLFYLIVGKLEAIGVPLQWALNVPSIVGFFLILLMIYLLGKKCFHDARVGILGIAFFLFNGSMSFVQFFQKHPLSLSTIHDIASSNEFSAMGPWDRGNVLGVWHLLVFISQRHFSVALGILLSFIYVCHILDGAGRKVQLYWALCFGILIGVFPVFHKAVLLIFAVAMLTYFVLLPFSRRFLFATGAISVAVMGILWLLSFNIFGAPTGFGWSPGAMIQGSPGVWNATKFFWHQFGLHTVLIPIGYYLAPKRARVLVLPAFIVLVASLLFRFSQRDPLVGHKFWNFFLIVGQMLTAYAVVRFYDLVSARFPRAKIAAFATSGILVFFLTLSGVIDFFPMINSGVSRVRDIASNPEAKWFLENTPRDAIIATSEFLYPAPSIAGRKVFMGYAYFTDGAGYDSHSRLKILDAIYGGGNLDEICGLLRANNIDFVDVEEFDPTPGRPVVDAEFFRTNFSPAYVSRNGRYAIYATASICN